MPNLFFAVSLVMASLIDRIAPYSRPLLIHPSALI